MLRCILAGTNCYGWTRLCKILVHFLLTWIKRRLLFYRKRNVEVATSEAVEEQGGRLPAVSVLKPLMGVDPNLSQNLETFFNIDYPKYELLFCVQDENDPAINVILTLVSKYVKVDARVFIGGKRIGINPKINNLLPGYQAAKYDLVMINDSGLKASRDLILDFVAGMTESVGLVHAMPYTSPRPGFAATLETIYFGTSHARIYISAAAFNINCVTGMSCLIRKPLLDAEGGLQAFGKFIAEDFFIAKAITERGYKIALASCPATQNHGAYSIRIFKARLARWCRLRQAILPVTILMESITECLPMGILLSWSFHYLFNCSLATVFITHLLVWFTLDYVQLRGVQGGPLPFSKFEYAVAWITRESLAILIFAEATLDPEVRWRTGRFRLKWGGLAEEVTDTS